MHTDQHSDEDFPRISSEGINRRSKEFSRQQSYKKDDQNSARDNKVRVSFVSPVLHCDVPQQSSLQQQRFINVDDSGRGIPSIEQEAYGDNPKQRLIDHNIERLQQINLKLRNKIKDLNSIVEKALERQSTKISKSSNLTFDADHMLRIREKEIENSKKQIAVNKAAVDKLKDKLRSLGPKGANDVNGEPISWETKYQMQLELKTRLEKNIKQLEKQNSLQGNAIEKATNSEDQQHRLKSLTEDLRVLK